MSLRYQIKDKVETKNIIQTILPNGQKRQSKTYSIKISVWDTVKQIMLFGAGETEGAALVNAIRSF